MALDDAALGPAAPEATDEASLLAECCCDTNICCCDCDNDDDTDIEEGAAEIMMDADEAA